jgi:hypothetical protein
VRQVHESHRAESVMPGRLVVGPWTLNPGTGVRIAPRQPVLKSQQRRKLIDERWREIRGVVKATVTSLVQKTHRIRRFPPQNCEVIQLARITGSDAVHARSNRALAANFKMRSQSLAAGYLTVYQEGRVQLPLRPPQG